MELLGQRFGHIRVTGIIGQGGMGEVYSGFDETLERRVALKVVHEDLRLDEDARGRLLREARALSKLDHPNICRIHDYIETGDSDLLVLEYIEGRTLADALRDKRTRAEKLRIAISVAEVLVSAHRAGILHRDLKPDNIMLANSGEVKVLDFGLARWLNRARHAISPQLRVAGASADYIEPVRTPSGRRGFVATQAGVAMGTPMYMSPEQARGEELTPASDMFAFGLLLQVLFTGAEPHPEFMGSRDVMLRVAQGETNPVQGIAGDVAALINRLKQAAPADRPTAVETLERLKWLAAKPVRVTRRGIAAAVALMIVLFAWRYTVDLQRERAAAVAAEKIAVAERAEAVRRRGQAEDLIDFMMGDLHRKLDRIGHLDALDAAAGRAMGYMSSLRPEMMSAAELARNATALDHLGQVRMAQGKLPEALKSFEQSLLIARSAVAREPGNLNLRFTLGQTQFWIGETHRRMDNRSGALAAMRDYLATSEALARAAPGNLDYQLELAYGYSNIGSLLEADRDFDGALQHYRRAMTVKQARLRTDPSNLDWQGDLAQTINKVGSALQQQGRLVEARRTFEEEQAIYTSLVRADPKNLPWKMRLITSYAYLSVLLVSLGDVVAAEEQAAAAEALAAELVAFDPANVNSRRDLAIVVSNRSIAQELQGRLAEARASAARSQTLMSEALRDAPQTTIWRRDLTIVMLQRARTLYVSGDLDAGAKLVRTALAAAPAGDPAWRQQVAQGTLLLGQIEAARGRADAARAQWNRTLELLAGSPIGPHELVLLDLRARALLLLGRDAEARPILDELRRARYQHPHLMRLPRVAAGAAT